MTFKFKCFKTSARTTSYLSGVKISPKIIRELLQVTYEDKHPENDTFLFFQGFGMRGRYFFELNMPTTGHL